MTGDRLIPLGLALLVTAISIGGLTAYAWFRAQHGELPVLHQEIARP